MSCDKLVFDLSQEVEGSPNVFIRKDWINILDNQNQNYQNNQSIIDTSQLSNSNKFMSYREAYLAVPMLLSLATPKGVNVINDYAIGLKNWFGSIIHSFTLDYNGTTIAQQTPFCNMWNSFKLMTTLSWADVATQGPTIGFYPDTAGSFGFWAAASGNGILVCNNDMGQLETSATSLVLNNYTQYSKINSTGTLTFAIPPAEPINYPLDVNSNTGIGGNYGLTIRTKWIAYSVYLDSLAGINTSSGIASLPYTSLLSSNSCNQIWKSYISTKVNPTADVVGALQISVMATIYLKHVHSFFNFVPLLKGVFMKITINLNNSTSQVTVTGAGTVNPKMTLTSSSSFIGGVVPIMVPSARTGSDYLTTGDGNGIYTYDLVVGAVSYNTTINEATKQGGQLAKSIYLYVPAYTFNPTFENAYLSNNIKQVKYTDIYQYQVLDIIGGGSGTFNNLITNGIANIKSVLIIPFFARDTATTPAPYNEFQSPFDPAGCGTTAPLVQIGNFNIQVSGQNAIYNMQRYSFEEWNNQLYGQNAVNGGLTDGLTSGLISFADFQQSYCYYYINVERMLPVEQSVPKSIQVLGTNYSQRAINLWVFVEYSTSVSIDLLTGSRV